MHSRRIKSIPTTYNGRCYRSRTEARWAVFFDALAVRFVYEPGPHRLPSGVYVPDFWLPDLGSYAEVKPGCGFTFGERTRCRELADAYPARGVLLLPGAPCHQAWQQLQAGAVLDVSLHLLPRRLVSVAAGGLPDLRECASEYVRALGRGAAEPFSRRVSA